MCVWDLQGDGCGLGREAEDFIDLRFVLLVCKLWLFVFCCLKKRTESVSERERERERVRE